MVTTWQGLLTLEPTLKQYQDDARSIAREAKTDWYGRWIGHFRVLQRDLQDVADRHDLDYAEIHHTAVASLVDVYECERQRERKRRERRPA